MKIVFEAELGESALKVLRNPERKLPLEPLQRTKKCAQDKEEEEAAPQRKLCYWSRLHLSVIYSKTRDVSTDVSLACS
jgi:hypothetical protein